MLQLWLWKQLSKTPPELCGGPIHGKAGAVLPTGDRLSTLIELNRSPPKVKPLAETSSFCSPALAF